jgi:hypothetical protein
MTYHHTQRAPLCWCVYLIAVVMLGSAWALRQELVAFAVLAISALPAIIFGAAFHHLTVADEGNQLAVYFGPLPLFQKRIRYEDIRGVEIGRTTVLDGWGIHWSLRGGWVWNIWGRDCVVIRLQQGVLRVGTDDPQGLAEFLRKRIAQHAPQ